MVTCVRVTLVFRQCSQHRAKKEQNSTTGNSQVVSNESLIFKGCRDRDLDAKTRLNETKDFGSCQE